MTGSIAMKYGHCFAEQQMRKEGVALDERGWPTWIEFTHDEFGLEVLEKEVVEKVYNIDINDWKEEEKKEYILDNNMYSAPIKLCSVDGKLTIVRYYHRAGEIMAQSMVKAGEFLKMRTPLAGEYKIGKSWAECH
jgi:hypothetical protein